MGVRESDGEGHAFEAADGLQPASIYLYEASVTGTETALLAAAAAEGRTEIRHAACEPHVAELCVFLAAARRLADQRSRNVHDSACRRRGEAARARRITYGAITSDAGSWAVVAAVTGGEIEIAGARAERHRGRGAQCCTAWTSSVRWTATSSGSSQSKSERRRGASPAVWLARFSRATSIPACVTVLATQAEGRTLVHDWLYELRLFALEQLSGMSADLFLCDPHRIIVTGPRRLRGRAVGQPRSALGNGVDCGGAGRGRPEQGRAARDGRARLRPARRTVAGAGREGREAGLGRPVGRR